MSNLQQVQLGMSVTRARRRILIVGGGYAGTRLARALDAAADVTLIERRDCFVHNVAAIRAVTDLAWLKEILLPYDRLLLRGQVIRGEVAQVRSDGVTLADGRMFEADYVVLAPGSSYASPFKPAVSDDQMAYQARVRAVHARLAVAGSVAIVGAGPVGIELAGEIMTAFSDKQVTLVSASGALMPGYRPALDQKLQRHLRGLGVTLLLDRRAISLPEAREPYGPAPITFEHGPAIDADLVFPVLGASPNTGFLTNSPGVSLNQRRIVVDDHLQLPQLANVFALGDAALTRDTLTISGIERQAPYLSKLLHRLIAGGEPSNAGSYKPWAEPLAVVPIGPEHGASQLPLSLVVGAWATKRIKGRHLFINKAKKGLGL